MRLGILGATGKVGSELLNLLESWNADSLPLSMSPKLFGTAKSAGREIVFRNERLIVQDSTVENLTGLDVLISVANGDASEKLLPAALNHGARLVIDSDSYYRMEPNVPLVMVGVNEADIAYHRGIVASPNCSVSQLVLPLGILHKHFGLERVVVSTYQSVSGAGKAAMDALVEQTSTIMQTADPVVKVVRVTQDQQFAFNVIPMISKLQANGYSKEEMKITYEARKMLHLPELPISCTAVRVPVMVGHSEAVNIQLKNQFTLNEVKDVLKAHPYIQLWEDSATYPTPIDVAGTQPVHIGRLRIDACRSDCLDMWIVADNLLIGAALNLLRILEEANKIGAWQ